MARRALPWIVLLAAVLHLIGIARSPLPAQDGLKFLRVARQFHHQPWADVVRASDQHPLYPALIALAQPAIGRVIGPGPDSWRLAAQGVSALASLALLAPLFGLARLAFDDETATLAVLLYVLLPQPAEVGHDTLADALALLFFALAFWSGALALRSVGLAAPIGCGLAAGVGYLARPEVLLVPTAVGMSALAGLVRSRTRAFLPPLPPGEGRGEGWSSVAPAEALTLTLSRGERGPAFRSTRHPDLAALLPTGKFPAMAISALMVVGLYALAKGEVSEKLALRTTAGLGAVAPTLSRAPHWMPPGLDDPRWDFSPKEETGHPAHLGFLPALRRLLGGWTEGLGWVFAPVAAWGAWRVPMARRGAVMRPLATIYLLLFGAVLIRHATGLGYLSGRHVLTMVLVALPWAAAGLRELVRRLAGRLRGDDARARRVVWGCLAAAILIGMLLQAKPGHPSRWGHLAAGRWLAENAGPADAVLDTRGWASFASGRSSYDYWHVWQALSDARLAYIVVGADELAAPSRRAATLRAVLAFAATPVAAFPEHRGGHDLGVQVFRFRRPSTWEGLRP